jgi:predicted MFS family arabinose efflux permease
VYYLKSLVNGQPSAPLAESETPKAPVIDYSRMSDLAWLGWIGGGVGVILITFVRAVFPVRAEAVLHLAQSTQGVIFFLVSLAQALTGLVLCRSRYWMYRPMAIMAFGLAGMLGLVAFGFGQTTLALVTGAVLFGVYSGSLFFYLVFHALVHPQRSSRYVAINESVVGVCSMAGAMIGGWVADRLGFGTLYAGGVVMLLVTLVFQWGIHRRHPILSK